MNAGAAPSRPRAGLVALVVVLILGLGVGAYAGTAALLRRDAGAAPAGSAASVAPTPGAGATHPLRGRITAISGRTWTVQPGQGPPLTVVVSGRTKFGTKKAPSTAAAFAVGARVSVSGPRVGDHIEARRIQVRRPRPTPSPSG